MYNIFPVQCAKLKETIAGVRTKLANKDNETAQSLREAVSQMQQQSLKLFEAAYKKMAAANNPSGGSAGGSTPEGQTVNEDQAKKEKEGKE